MIREPSKPLIAAELSRSRQKGSQPLSILCEAFIPFRKEQEPVRSGTLVETEHTGTNCLHLPHFMCGYTVEHEGFDCTVLAPDSSLYQNFPGTHVGDVFDDISLLVLGKLTSQRPALRSKAPLLNFA